MSTSLPSSALPKSEEEALKEAEAARETRRDKPAFLRELFLGTLRMDLIYPFPQRTGLDRKEFRDVYQQMKTLLDEIDSDAIDRQGKIPPQVIKQLAAMGALGMKIEKKYGGLGLTQTEYNEMLKLVGSRDSNLTALLSAHQSVGVTQPLIIFGNKEQQKKYLPRIAKGAVTGFAFSEPDVGSDPGKLSTSVEETDGGKTYLLNGEKLRCTNGTIAQLLLVMARHKEDGSISAFIVETDWEGVEVTHHCHFMGLKALENAKIRFKNVRIPTENLLWKRGQGLKLAFTTLNTGRLALPAAAVGSAKTCLEIVRQWANERVQRGKVIGKHEAIAHKIADMAADTFAMESLSDLATAMAEDDFDIRLEAAVAKMFNTETVWRIIDDTLQIHGGRGSETTDSLKGRGEAGIAVERMLRDARINLILEDSSEILRLFIAREALDKHLQIAGILLDKRAPLRAKMKALPKIGAFYARWYLSLWLAWSRWPKFGEHRRLAKHLRYVDRAARKLGRQIFHTLLWHQGGLQSRQALLARLVDIGADLFAMGASISRARKLFREGNRNAVWLADLFCRNAKKRIKANFNGLWSNNDRVKYRLAQQVLDRQFSWLEKGGAGVKSELSPEESPVDVEELLARSFTEPS